MRPSLSLIATCFLAVPALAQGAWQPIPPEVWALKSDPKAVASGAVFTSAYLGLDNRTIRHAYQVRILSEAGKAAAEWAALPQQATDVQARTILPDGKVIPLQSARDLQTKTILATRWDSVERKVVIPPGVTSDCVVEFRYTLPYDFIANATNTFGYMHHWLLAARFPVKTYTIEVNKLFAWTWTFLPVSNVRLEQAEKAGNRLLILRDVPPLEDIPYSLDSLRVFPRLEAFPVPQSMLASARRGARSFWTDLAKDLYRPALMDRLTRGSAYKELSALLRKDLPAGAAGAATLIQRMHGYVRNVDAPSHAEKVAFPKPLTPKDIDVQDLSQTAKRGATSSWGIRLLAMELLRDHGVLPVLGFVGDREIRPADPDQPNLQQFHSVLVGVPQADGGIQWFDPDLRFMPLGFTLPEYQGVKVLVVDSQAWTHAWKTIPVDVPEANGQSFSYTIGVGEDSDTFSATAGFKGFPEFLLRRRYLADEPAEQARKLKELFQSGRKSLSVAKAEVRNAAVPGAPVGWLVEGSLEAESGRRRAVDPFPGLAAPLYVPEEFPATRSENIHLRNLGTFEATSTVKVPKGFKALIPTSLSNENLFGSVSRTVAVHEGPEGEVLTLKLKVTTTRIQASPVQYREFQAFLGWMREAVGTLLVLERSS